MNENREEWVASPPVESATEGVKKREASALLREWFFGALWALWAYVLGGCRLPFAAYPFGVALLCAATRRVPYVLAGLCLSAVSMSAPALRVLSYAAVVLVRLLSRFTVDNPWQGEGRTGERTLGEVWPHLFAEHVGLRMATSCIGVFIVGLYTLIRGGFLYYDLYGAILAVIAAPVATLIFSGAFAGETSDGRRAWWRFVSFAVLSAAVTYGARDIRLLGISGAAFGTMFLTLYVTRRYGTVKGILTGSLCGLAYSPVLTPVFAFGALCGGLFFPVSVTLSVLVTFVVGSAWALYVSGLGVLYSLLPALLASTLLYASLDKLFFSPTRERVAREEGTVREVSCRVLSDSELDGVCLSDMSGRVKTLCESFTRLAEVFAAMEHTMGRPGESELRRICDSAFDSSCGGCPSHAACWEERYAQTDAEISEVCAALHRHGRVEFCHVGEGLAERCGRLPDILDEINCNASLYAARMRQCDRTEIFAMDYAFMSDVLAETMEREREEYEPNAVLSDSLAEALRAEGQGLCGVLAFGRSKRRVTVRSETPLSGSVCESIAQRIASLGGFLCDFAPSARRADGLYDTYFTERERMAVSFARRTVRAEGEEEYCGDTVGVFRRENRYYAFISDGMGAGREAALTSGICALFLQKLLQAGNRCETVLSMLNGFLRNKGSGSLHECSATVDLMELDLICGRASFYKSGAAPTYVLRDGSLFKLRSKTLPVGILKETDVKRISFDLTPGDVIVMVSDGVTQGREECPWLFDLLRSNVETLGIEKTADLIVRYAKGEGAEDDLSVLILRTENAELTDGVKM